MQKKNANVTTKTASLKKKEKKNRYRMSRSVVRLCLCVCLSLRIKRRKLVWQIMAQQSAVPVRVPFPRIRVRKQRGAAFIRYIQQQQHRTGEWLRIYLRRRLSFIMARRELAARKQQHRSFVVSFFPTPFHNTTRLGNGREREGNGGAYYSSLERAKTGFHSN